jgi:hypothetical protein
MAVTISIAGMIRERRRSGRSFTGFEMRKAGKWERRLLIAAGVLIVGTLLGHGLWTYLAGRGVRSRVAALKAAGEPVLPVDFATDNPDAPDNGGPDIFLAGEVVDRYQRLHKAFDDFDLALPLRPQEKQAIEQATQDLAAPMGRFRRAIAKPRLEWKLNLTSPVLFNVVLMPMNGVRALCRMECAAALLEHEKGDDAAALACIERAILLSRYADKNPSLVGHLVSIGCLAMASAYTMEIAPDLKIGTAPGDVPPEQLKRVIATLLDDVPPREGLHLALRGERMGQLDTVQSIINGTPFQIDPKRDSLPGTGNPVARYAFRPFFYHNASFMLDHMTGMMSAVSEPDFPAARTKITPKPQNLSPMHMMANILLPAMERAMETHFRVTADRRLAAITLAIRWYAIDHGGKRPQTLGELVPRYLPAIPKDSLLRDKPMGYLPDPVDPRLYSAGANNEDDGGSEAWIRPMSNNWKPGRGSEWNTLDRIVHLNRPPRPPPEPDPNAPPVAEEPATTNPAP